MASRIISRILALASLGAGIVRADVVPVPGPEVAAIGLGALAALGIFVFLVALGALLLIKKLLAQQNAAHAGMVAGTVSPQAAGKKQTPRTSKPRRRKKGVNA